MTLADEVKKHWGPALECWSLLTLLREPEIVTADATGNIAYIRLRDARIVLDVAKIEELGLVPYTKQILAHEIGHHVYVPGNMADHFRMLARVAPVLDGLPRDTIGLVANLYADLLINDRLTRRAQLAMVDVYRQMKLAKSGGAGGGPASKAWMLYMRICEHLWRTPRGHLIDGEIDAEMEGDALLVARMVRTFASDWLRGARRFAVVFYKYFQEDAQAAGDFNQRGLFDLKGAQGSGAGAGEKPDVGDIPDGLTEDAADSDDLDLPNQAGVVPANRHTPHKGSTGQTRTPFEYLQLLKSIGIDVEKTKVVAKYYRERALPHLLPFPSQRAPRSKEPLPEGTIPWEPGESLEDLDLSASLQQSPVVIPGVTTVQRVYGESPGYDPAPLPMDLDIYVDCSGSMPDPTFQLSYLTLAATILTLSALRAGASVQATLWAHAGHFMTTNGFLRDEQRLLAVITQYLSGGTAFPLHILRDTYAKRAADRPPAHVVVISDNGVNTMLEPDEKKTPGATIVKEALARARGGCTLVLNLAGYDKFPGRDDLEALGCVIYSVSQWEELIAFARAFVRQTYKA